MSTKPRLCANMIVRNESAIIERCCEALARVVDCFVIADTGSTDDTPAIIERTFARHGISGEIVHTKFVDFEQSRNFALEAARASKQEFDYILFCDADMEIVEDDPSWRSFLDGPVYALKQRSAFGGVEYPNIRIVRRGHPCRYVGVTHEFLDAGPYSHLSQLWFIDHQTGANRVEKYERDIRLLTSDLERNPSNARTVFYLANSYYDSGQLESAIEFYRRRMTMDGYRDEIFISQYRVGLALHRLGDEGGFFKELLLCYNEFPHRAEAIHALALHAQRTQRHHLALGLANMVVNLPIPVGGLFVETEVYDWRVADIVAVSLYWVGRSAEAIPINERLLDIVPAGQRERIAANLDHCRWAMAR